MVDYSAVERMLTSHGVSERTQRTLREIGAELRQRSASTGDERAAMVSNRTGRRLGRILRGEPNRVDISPHIAAMVPDHPYVQLHTHPGSASASFSERDAFNVVGVPGIEVMVVVGVDGAWYVLSRADDFAVPESERNRQRRLLEVFNAFWNHLNALKPSHDERVNTGEFDDAQARHALTHEVWVLIAPGLRLRYDRVDAPGSGT